MELLVIAEGLKYRQQNGRVSRARVFSPLPRTGEAALVTPMRAIRTMWVRGAKRSELPLMFEGQVYSLALTPLPDPLPHWLERKKGSANRRSPRDHVTA